MRIMRIRIQIMAAVFALFGAMTPLHAGQFPWEPAKPAPAPVISTQPKTPQQKAPTVEPTTRVVPGHMSNQGYVPTYESTGPVHAPTEPGQKSQGWVPGHHDANGAWVPGHPE